MEFDFKGVFPTIHKISKKLGFSRRELADLTKDEIDIIIYNIEQGYNTYILFDLWWISHEAMHDFARVIAQMKKV
jgi:hypothetical protein